MGQSLTEIHLVRHGETARTVTRQDTRLNDIPLTERRKHTGGGYLRSCSVTARPFGNRRYDSEAMVDDFLRR